MLESVISQKISIRKRAVRKLYVRFRVVISSRFSEFEKGLKQQPINCIRFSYVCWMGHLGNKNRARPFSPLNR